MGKSSLDISIKEGKGNREQEGVINNLSIIIDFIFYFWRSLLVNLNKSIKLHP